MRVVNTIRENEQYRRHTTRQHNSDDDDAEGLVDYYCLTLMSMFRVYQVPSQTLNLCHHC